uniref:Uncharacterized protein n=1 Tax=Rhizophora mucronata TaxID=61149 RepID=A0A2P2MQI5_RHIMU
MGDLAKTYLDLSCEMQEAEKICQGRRDKIRAKRLQMEKVQMRISKEKNPIRLEELHKKLKKLRRGFKPELENDMDYEAKKAKQAAFEHESKLLDALHEVDTVTVTSKEDIQQVEKEVKMKCRLVIRADDWKLIAHACYSGLGFLLYSP